MSSFLTDGQINALIAGVCLWFANKVSSNNTAGATQQTALLKRISDVETNETSKEKQWHEERQALRNALELVTKERNELAIKLQDEHSDRMQLEIELARYQGVGKTVFNVTKDKDCENDT